MSDPGYVSGRKRSTKEVIHDLWRSRRILTVLIRRDLNVRYAESVLGYVWSVLEPLLLGAIYWFVFTQIFDRKVGGDPYIIFLLSGMLPWMWFGSGLTEGAKALLSQRRLIASTALPRQIWVFRSVGAKGVEFLFSIPVFIIFLLAYPPDYNLKLLLVPVGIIIQLLLLLGLGFLLSPIMMLSRDLEPIIRLATRALFYATPIIYGVNDVLSRGMPKALEVFYLMNPLTGIMECYRAGFFDQATRYDAIGFAAALSVLVLLVGWFVFRRLEPQVLKEI